MKLLKNEVIDGYKVIKIKNVYPLRNNSEESEEQAQNFINSYFNEFAMGQTKVDAGNLVSNDDITGKKQKRAFGGLHSSLLKSCELVRKFN